MTKASDNLFPGIIIRESANDGSDFSNPSADYRRLFLGEDGALHAKDSAGSVTDLTGSSVFDPDAHLPWLIHIIPMLDDPSTNTGPWALSSFPTPVSVATTFYLVGTAANSGAYSALLSSGAQNDEVEWPVILAAGTWNLELHHRTSTNVGIYTVEIDGSSVGTIDGYAAAAGFLVSAITGISVATTGKKLLSLAMLTKNASSSSYFGEITGISLRRTA